MSAAPSPQTPPHVFVSDREGRRVRRDHQQKTHVLNRMLCRLGVPDKAARGVFALLGLFNGRETFPALIAHRWAARQMNYKGKEENADQFVGRVLDAVREAERSCGRKFFEIERADGVTTIITTYHADYIGEAALWALTEARRSEEWKKHPAKAVTDELIERAVEKLPPCEPRPARERDPEAPSVTDAAVVEGLCTRGLNLIASALDKQVVSGGDPRAVAQRLIRQIERMGEEKARAQAERDRRARAEERERDPEGMWGEDGNNISDTSEKFSTAIDPAAEGPTPPQTDPPSPPEPPESQGTAQSALPAALELAGQGVAVFPLKPRGKAPLGRLAPHGVYDATTEPDTIREWFEQEPEANYGVAMGGPLRLLGVDVDTRKGGDASLHDLCEAYGDDWLDTYTVSTGGGGFHFYLTLPAGVEFRRGKLAPGIDLKFEGGYLVGPGSLHPSGRRYEVLKALRVAEAPPWLVEELTRKPEEPPRVVVNFQERRERRAAYEGDFIPDGERNETLFKRVACSLRARGAEYDEILSALRDAHARCERPHDISDSLLRDMARRVCRDYAAGSPPATSDGSAA